jgi:hypothetical protein
LPRSNDDTRQKKSLQTLLLMLLGRAK